MVVAMVAKTDIETVAKMVSKTDIETVAKMVSKTAGVKVVQ